MKRLLLISSIALLSSSSFGQGQFENADFELWQDVGSATEEPENWSGIKTASGNGTLIAFAPQAITRSSLTHSGVGYCIRLVANTAFTTVANGTVTCGRLNVGSATASDPSNYSYTDTADDAWSQALTDTPDSIVWWAKFTAADSLNLDSARMKATLHDDYNYQDPEDAMSSSHVVATAVLNYPHSGVWVRYSAPFDYSGPVSNNTYILVTFTTNKTPGGGNGGDEVLLDDVELIYNSVVPGPVDTDGDGVLDSLEVLDGTDEMDPCDFILASQTEVPSAQWDADDCDLDGVPNAQDTEPLVGIYELNGEQIVVAMDNSNNLLVLKSEEKLNGNYTIVNSSGQIVQKGALANTISFEMNAGVYFLHIEGAADSHKFVKY